MNHHDADRINGAFSDMARKLENLVRKVSALEAAIQTQGQEIVLLKKQNGQLAAQRVG